MNTFKLPELIIGVVAALMLAACGGGSSSGGASNRAPVANAGPAQSVTTGTLVTLDGRASSDADGDTLTYAWTLPTRPTGSTATLSGATTARPTFTADVAGTYTASLVVNDGTVNSAPATVTITATAPGAAPVANAGSPQSVIVPTVVTLDGSGSTAAAGATLTYGWTLPTRPAGSAATMVNSTSVKPTFTADVAGTYTASLVVNDGTTSSAPSTVTITGSAATGNAPPVANAGPNQNVTLPTTVFLDGSGSSDPDGDPLAYSWLFSSQPDGSTATLAGATTITPNFSPDLAGVYQVRLVVNDGQVNSAPATVQITAATDNSAPIANAGPAQEVIVGETVTLDGSASSDADGDPLTYTWSMTTRPTGSSAALTNPTSISPTFTADVAGIYVVSLVVNDGELDSTANAVSVSAFMNGIIGEPYLGRNGITVTLDAITMVDRGGGITRYTMTYTQENKTTAAIPAGSLRLYFTNESPVHQFFIPSTIQPGETFTFEYSFDVSSSDDPWLLQYDGDHFYADEPIVEAVQWRFPIQ